MKYILVVNRVFKYNDGDNFAIIKFIGEKYVVYTYLETMQDFLNYQSKDKHFNCVEACLTHKEFKERYTKTNYYFDSEEV